MTNQASVIELLHRADEATNNIAADIRRLLDRPDVPQEVKDRAEALATRLEAVASEVPEDSAPPTEPPAGGGGGEGTPGESRRR